MVLHCVPTFRTRATPFTNGKCGHGLLRASSFRRGVAVRASASKIPDDSVSVVLLAGGVGKRMGAPIPKQYLELCGKPIATHSFITFSKMPEVAEIIVVCDPSWKHIFEDKISIMHRHVPVKWALPGDERQDSVYNGIQALKEGVDLVAIHDSARPMIQISDLRACLADAMEHGAAVLGVPVKPTIKEVGADMFVERTLVRSKLWDVQTPQVMKPDLLRKGFEAVAKDGLEVTDDVSIIEAIGLPVKMTQGSYTNIKVTTPDDMSVAERLMTDTH